MSAVSKSVIPASSAASTTARVPSRSTRRPKLLHPSPTTETSGPPSPSFRVRMAPDPTRVQPLTPCNNLLLGEGGAGGCRDACRQFGRERPRVDDHERLGRPRQRDVELPKPLLRVRDRGRL